MLNADFTPFAIIGWKQALKQTVVDSKDSCYAVEYYEEWVILDASGVRYPIPSIIAMKKYVNYGDGKAGFSNRNVFFRDNMRCQYCGEVFNESKLTVDHVIPRSRWTAFGNKKGMETCFENIVTACSPCNALKGDKTCKESDMYPLNPPRKTMTLREVFTKEIAFKQGPVEWGPYLEGIK